MIIVRIQRGTLLDETLLLPDESGLVPSSLSAHLSNNEIDAQQELPLYDEDVPGQLPEPDRSQINSHDGIINVVGLSVIITGLKYSNRSTMLKMSSMIILSIEFMGNAKTTIETAYRICN